MNIINQFKKIYRNPYKIFRYLSKTNILKYVPDKTYLKLMYRGSIEKKLNIDEPKGFNEKLQWLKLNDRKSIYTKLVDKYEVREYVSNLIGTEYLIPCLGIYNSFEEINFDELPEKFVLKCTHDSGGVIICKDKNELDLEQIKKQINNSLKKNYYYLWREWPYKNVKPRIICEKYMEDEVNKGIDDYKFMCFNEEPKVIQFHTARFENHKQYHYDIEGNLMPFNNEGYSNDGAPKLDMEIIKKMIPLVKKLSKELIHIRVDFYYINGKVYFGELTFYDASGFEKIIPEKYDYLLGSWIDLSKL